MDPVLSPIVIHLSAGTSGTTAGSLTAPLGGLTTPSGGSTVRPTEDLVTPPSGPTTRVAEVDGPTACPTSLTHSPMPHVATMTPPSAPCTAPMTLASTSVPCAAPTPPPAASSTEPISPPAAQPMVHQLSMWTCGLSASSNPSSTSPSLSLILKSVWAALVDHHWRVAMDEEYTALMTNGTWDLVSRPCSGNVVTDKWMFKHKFKANETLESSS
jgi:hypothetical protein